MYYIPITYVLSMYYVPITYVLSMYYLLSTMDFCDSWRIQRLYLGL